MPVVAALLEHRGTLAALRRGAPRGGSRIVACRSPAALARVLRTRLVDAIVLDPRSASLDDALRAAAPFPGAPRFAFAGFRPDDGDLLAACVRQGLGLLVEGVDDAVTGELIARHSAQAARRRALADAPRLLRLRSPLQREVWTLLLALVDRPLRTSDLARRLGVTREHLSRQFAVEAAPNLKRVIDLVRVATAAQLLADPGHTTASVAAVLHFTSAPHLNRASRRIAGVRAGALAELGPRGVLDAFVRGKTRSRI